MRYRLKYATLLLSCCMGAGIQVCLAADDSVGLGLYLKPEFPGANDYEKVVLPSLNVEVGGVGLSLKDVDMSLDFVPSPVLNTGLTIRYDEGRDDSESDETVRLLTPVEAAPEFGLFIESGVPVRLLGLDDSALLIGSANLRTAFGAGHGGHVFEVKVGILRELNSQSTVIAQLVLARSDAKYNRSYFGVNRRDARLTGLPEYRPGNALKEIGATLIFNRQMGGHWYAGVLTTVTRLSNELANSPIVDQHGSRFQWLSGAFLTYHF